jgi:hypothetical protein
MALPYSIPFRVVSVCDFPGTIRQHDNWRGKTYLALQCHVNDCLFSCFRYLGRPVRPSLRTLSTRPDGTSSTSLENVSIWMLFSRMCFTTRFRHHQDLRTQVLFHYECNSKQSLIKNNKRSFSGLMIIIIIVIIIDFEGIMPEGRINKTTNLQETKFLCLFGLTNVHY